MDDLSISIPVFLISALAVVIAGVALAKFGDDIAEQTGWGALWVGTILVSVATSLPELVTNVSAVLIGSPGLALGNVFGADMINIFTIALVALGFGTGNLFGGQAKDTQTLVLVAIVIGVIAMAFGIFGDISVGRIGLGSIVIVVSYVVGMKMVHSAGRDSGDEASAQQSDGKGQAARAWFGFLAAGALVLAAAPFLALSADGIAEATGLGRSFVGVVLVSIVTTLPEASVTVAAAIRKSYGLVVGNIYGSCAFNLFVIPVADIFYSDGPVLARMEASHFVAAGSAIGLMFAGFLIIQSFKVRLMAPLSRIVFVIPPAYVAALFLVFSSSRL